MVDEALFSTGDGEWRTPTAVLAYVETVFFDGQSIELDPAATKENAVAPKFYTKEDDGLAQPWHGRVFVNPPYGRGVGDWVEKAIAAYLTGAKVVMLLPARTDTAWFSRLWKEQPTIDFIRGRIRFVGAPASAPFPSMLVCVGGKKGSVWLKTIPRLHQDWSDE